MSNKYKFIISTLIIVLCPIATISHSGRTDKYGGHNNRKTGGYHYHNSGKINYSKPIRETVSEKVEFTGIPYKKIEIVDQKSKEYSLSDNLSKKNKTIIIKKGNKYYWKTRSNDELEKRVSGAYVIYNSKKGAGYIKIEAISDRKLYTEHVHFGLNTITYFGTKD